MKRINFIEWDLEYSVDVPEIDRQHKELMNLLNDAIHHSSGNPMEERAYFNKRIEVSINFIIKHFEMEEQFLSKTKYEKYNEHKMEHKKILEEIQNKKEEIQSNELEVDLKNMTEYLKEWLINHIKEYDKKAKEYFLDGKNKQ